MNCSRMWCLGLRKRPREVCDQDGMELFRSTMNCSRMHLCVCVYVCVSVSVCLSVMCVCVVVRRERVCVYLCVCMCMCLVWNTCEQCMTRRMAQGASFLVV
jgi:ABC-type polysaccharide transport system permease subunit